MKNLRGFTLIELLVVMGIISILAAMLLPGLAAARRSGRSVSCVNNLRNIGQAIEQYLQDQSYFIPTALGGSVDDHYSLAYVLQNDRVFECPEQRGTGERSYGRNSRITVAKWSSIPTQWKFPIVFDAHLQDATYYSDLDNRHSGIANVLYGDYRVEKLGFDQVTTYGAVALPGVPEGYQFAIDLYISGSRWDQINVTFTEDGSEAGTASVLPGGGTWQIADLGLITFRDPNTTVCRIRVQMEYTNRRANARVWMRIGSGGWRYIGRLRRGSSVRTKNITAWLKAAM